MNTNVQPMKTPQERNRETWKQHRQEVFRQITLPLLIGGGILLALAVLVVLGSTGAIDRWADISIIWLIGPTFLFTFLAMLALAGLVYLTVIIIVKLPFFSYRVLLKLKVLQAAVQNASDRAVAPFIKAAGIKASIHTAIHWPAKGNTSASSQPFTENK